MKRNKQKTVRLHLNISQSVLQFWECSCKKCIEEILSEVGDAEHVIPRESQQTGPNMMAQETRDVNTAQESRDEVELGTAGENQTETEEENNP